MNTNNKKMLYSIAELNSLFEENNIEQFLLKTVDMVALHMNASICSIYIYNELEKKLTLRATKELHPPVAKLEENLIASSLRERRIIYQISDNDSRNSFLIAPIIRGIHHIGVLTVQRENDISFDKDDIIAIEAAASQLGTILEHVKYITQPVHIEVPDKPYLEVGKLQFFLGITASKGSLRAPIMVKPWEKGINTIAKELGNRHFTISDFDKAIEKTYRHLEDIQKKVEEKLVDAASLIFASHLLMLKDEDFTGAMRELIISGKSVDKAIMEVFLKYKGIFTASGNSIIKEKTQDIEDLTSEILGNLLDKDLEVGAYKDHIVVAKELFPSELLTLSADEIAGIVLISGGVTSHVGILARSLMIPLVIINDPVLLTIPNGTDALIDADIGALYINPTSDVLHKFELKDALKDIMSASQADASGTAYTNDGHLINVMLNLNLISDLKQIKIEDIDGIGLYRTEFPFMIRDSFPSEEEQNFIYKRLTANIADKPVTFRTLDIGGDKALAYYDFPLENNPALGMRSVRFSLEHIEIFKQQIRAILRAGYGIDLKMMFPMISSVDEFISARDVIWECIDELGKYGIKHNNTPSIGTMIEIPSLLPVIDELAKECDFFSIGTNDLIQYTLAVDRTNEKVSSMYMPHHPAILNAIKVIAAAAKKAGIEVSLCGDMANKEIYIPFIIGAGITCLSVDAMYVPRVKRTIRKTSILEATRFAEKILSLKRISDIEAALKEQDTEKQ